MRISVALATYEGEAWLARQLASIALQSRKPDELIVSDDASTDATMKILERFAARVPFTVRIRSQATRVGSTRNFETAIAAAEGDIICLCDQDDVWHPDKLERTEAAFAADPALDLFFSDADVVDEALRPLGYSLWQSIGFGRAQQSTALRLGLLPVLTRFNVVTGAAMAFASGHRGLILPIPEGWIHDAWIAIILAGVGRYRWLNQPLLAYRQHARQHIGAGPRSLGGRIEIARRMDGAYFDRLAGNFAACKDRLASGTNVSAFPAPDAYGEGERGEFLSQPVVHPHPNPPPEYQGRGKKQEFDQVGLANSGRASARTLELIQQKIDHCIARRDLRLARFGKSPRLLRELFSGRYFSSSLGVRSVLQDLLLT